VDHLHWRTRPVLQRPVLLVAFEGWNDAGDAASGAVRYLIDRYDAELVAEIDPEEFFDFTSTRPQAELGDDGAAFAADRLVALAIFEPGEPPAYR